MATNRLYGVTDIRYRLGEEKPWRIGGNEKPWKLESSPRPRASTLALAPPDVPAPVPFVPSPRPPALKPRNGGGIISGLAVPWNQPTEIRSPQEGHFFEQFSPGSFRDSLANPPLMLAALFQHGQDPAIGYKALGPIQAWESSRGLEFEVATLDVDYVRDILAGVEAGVYGGASVRFSTVRDNVRRKPGRSASNPRGIEERVIQQARLREVSVVLWPAYSGTSVAA